MKRLGLAVSGDAVRAVVVHRGSVRWAGERKYKGVAELGEALAQLAGEIAPRARRARVALEADVCQVKLTDKLPPLAPRRLRNAVALQVGRWFLRNGRPLVTGAIRHRDGTVLLAAAEQPLVRDVAAGLAAAGIRLMTVAPAPVALAAMLPDGTHRRLGTRGVEVLDVRRGQLVGWRRSPMHGSEPDEAVFAGLEPALVPFAVAVAVAKGGSRLDLMAQDRVASRARVVARAGRRLVVAGLAAWLLAGGTYAVRVERALRRERARLEALEPGLAPALRLQQEIAQADAALATLDAAAAARSHDLVLLARLTEALGDSVHFITVRRTVDGGVSAAGFAPSAASVIARLETVEGLAGARLDGPVTRERVGERVLERFAARFEWNGRRGARP